MRSAMRWGLAVVLACAAGAAADDKKDDPAAKERAKFAGAWVVESQTVGGKTHMPKPGDDIVVISFDGDKFTLKSGDKVVQAGTFEVDPGKKPKALDLKLTEGDGKGGIIQGIYELDGDKFTFCGVRGGPRPTEFAAPDASKAVLSVAKREKKK
jgi:uncharacterized protein (TIGR03067 family)